MRYLTLKKSSKSATTVRYCAERLQPEILILIANLELLNLARDDVPQLVNEDEFVGQPFGDLFLKVEDDYFTACVRYGPC